MKYYKDNQNQVFAYESVADRIKYGKPELVEITEQEALVIVNPPPTPEQLQQQTNAQARAYLASTDWYVIRMQERGTAIPQEILDARQAARDSIIEVGGSDA
jgi:hypothetical protein